MRPYEQVVLSPHFDDAALSLGGTIAGAVERGERVLIATICARAPSPRAKLGALARELTGGDAFGWVRTRRSEELRAAKILGAESYFGSAFDAIFREPEHYSDFDALFAAPVRGDRLLSHAYGLIRALAEHSPDALFFAPLGIGGHVDHRIAHDAARRAVPSARLRFYEDFPYVLRPGATARRLEELGRAFQREARTIAHDKKLRAIAAYESQVSGLFGTKKKMRAAVLEHRTESLYSLGR